MLNYTPSTSFILLTFLIGLSEQTDKVGTIQPYQDHVYLYTYMFFWFFLIEISLVIIIHYKHTSLYWANHSFINFCIVVGTLINNIMFYKKMDNWQQFELFFYEGLILILEII